MTKLLKTAAIGLSTVAALALAQPSVAAPFGGASATAGAAASAAGSAAAAPGKRAQAQRYCGNTVQTASRIVRRECKTQEEWAHEGVDILSKK